MRHRLNRRRFLARAGLGGAGLCALGHGASARSAEDAAVRPCPASAWRKHGVVLPDDQGPVQDFTSPAEPLGEGRWRLWYTGTGAASARNIGFAEGVPGEPMTRHLAALSPGDPADAPFAIGNLPDEWRPVQVVHLRLQSGRHRIYFWAHGPQGRALSGGRERRRPADIACSIRHGPASTTRLIGPSTARPRPRAGLSRWAGKVSSRPEGEPAAPASLVSNDATNVYQLADGTFEMYSVALVEVAKDDPAYIAHDNAAGWVRVIDRYESDDGLRWTGRRRVLVPDDDDPSDMQFYYLAVTYTDRGAGRHAGPLPRRGADDGLGVVFLGRRDRVAAAKVWAVARAGHAPTSRTATASTRRTTWSALQAAGTSSTRPSTRRTTAATPTASRRNG